MKKILVYVAAVMMGLAWNANADTTFAQFVDLGGAPFTFSDTGPGSTFAGSTQGYITFLYPGVLQGQQLANITLTSSAESSAQTGFGGLLLAQPIDGATNTLSFIRPSDGANLLTVTFSGFLVGFNGDVNASLESTSTTFTSQFLSFTGAGTEGALISTSAINPGFTLDGGDGFANTFTSDLTGAFTAANTPQGVPDSSSTWTLLAMGGACLMLIFRRRVKA